MRRAAIIVLVLSVAGSVAGCASEPWASALDDLPKNATTAEGLPERAALEGPDAPQNPTWGADPSPAYLERIDDDDRRRQSAMVLAKPRLTIADAIHLAELNSRDLVASYEQIVASHGAVLSAAAYPNPSFAFASGPVSTRQFYPESVAGQGHGYPLFPQASYTFTVPIVTGLRLVWAKREAIANEWAARATWQVLRRNDVQGVQTAYVNALYAKENFALQSELQTLAEELDRISLRQIEAGVITAADKLATEVAVAQQRAALETSRQAVVGAEAALSGAIGGARMPAEKLSGALLGDVASLPVIEILEADVAKTHPLVRAGELAVSAARADTRLQRAVLWPDVALSLGYERDYFDSPPNRTFDEINFGLALTLPAFDQNQGAIMTSDANLRAAQANLEFTETGLVASLRGAYSNVLAQRRQVAELREHVIPIAEKALDFTKKSFEAGSSRVIDVLNARQNLAGARASLLTALQSLDQSIAGLENLTGRRMLELQ